MCMFVGISIVLIMVAIIVYRNKNKIQPYGMA